MAVSAGTDDGHPFTGTITNHGCYDALTGVQSSDGREAALMQANMTLTRLSR